jgi:hypothetical protein
MNLLTEMQRALDNLLAEAEKRMQMERDTLEWHDHQLRMDALLDKYLAVTGR